MISDWKACLLNHAGEWGLPQSGEWSFLFFNNYHPHCSDMDVLWFWNAEDHPRVVTKISREPDRPEREFANLRQAFAAAPSSVPRPLHFGAQGNFWLLWMRGVPGMRYKGNLTEPVMRSMVETVAGIHSSAARPAGSAHPGRYRRAITEPLRALSEFGAEASVVEGCRWLLADAGESWLEKLPVIPQHGDLYDGNLLERAGAWYVVDWESFGTVDLPAYDLYTLLLSLLLADGAPNDKWRAGLTAQIPDLVALYGERLGLAQSNLARLLPLTLANWFYLQWKDGRAEFSNRLYPAIKDYFENRERWENIFLSRATQ